MNREGRPRRESRLPAHLWDSAVDVRTRRLCGVCQTSLKTMSCAVHCIKCSVAFHELCAQDNKSPGSSIAGAFTCTKCLAEIGHDASETVVGGVGSPVEANGDSGKSLVEAEAATPVKTPRRRPVKPNVEMEQNSAPAGALDASKTLRVVAAPPLSTQFLSARTSPSTPELQDTYEVPVRTLDSRVNPLLKRKLEAKITPAKKARHGGGVGNVAGGNVEDNSDQRRDLATTVGREGQKEGAHTNKPAGASIPAILVGLLPGEHGAAVTKTFVHPKKRGRDERWPSHAGETKVVEVERGTGIASEAAAAVGQAQAQLDGLVEKAEKKSMGKQQEQVFPLGNLLMGMSQNQPKDTKASRMQQPLEGQAGGGRTDLPMDDHINRKEVSTLAYCKRLNCLQKLHPSHAPFCSSVCQKSNELAVTPTEMVSKGRADVRTKVLKRLRKVGDASPFVKDGEEPSAANNLLKEIVMGGVAETPGVEEAVSSELAIPDRLIRVLNRMEGSKLPFVGEQRVVERLAEEDRAEAVLTVPTMEAQSGEVRSNGGLVRGKEISDAVVKSGKVSGTVKKGTLPSTSGLKIVVRRGDKGPLNESCGVGVVAEVGKAGKDAGRRENGGSQMGKAVTGPKPVHQGVEDVAQKEKKEKIRAHDKKVEREGNTRGHVIWPKGGVVEKQSVTKNGAGNGQPSVVATGIVRKPVQADGRQSHGQSEKPLTMKDDDGRGQMPVAETGIRRKADIEKRGLERLGDGRGLESQQKIERRKCVHSSPVALEKNGEVKRKGENEQSQHKVQEPHGNMTPGKDGKRHVQHSVVATGNADGKPALPSSVVSEKIADEGRNGEGDLQGRGVEMREDEQGSLQRLLSMQDGKRSEQPPGAVTGIVPRKPVRPSQAAIGVTNQDGRRKGMVDAFVSALLMGDPEGNVAPIAPMSEGGAKAGNGSFTEASAVSKAQEAIVSVAVASMQPEQALKARQKAVKVAEALEAAMYSTFGGLSKKYNVRGQILVDNLKAEGNAELRASVLSGELQPEALCKMTSEQLAADGSNMWRNEQAAAAATAVPVKDERDNGEMEMGKSPSPHQPTSLIEADVQDTGMREGLIQQREFGLPAAQASEIGGSHALENNLAAVSDQGPQESEKVFKEGGKEKEKDGSSSDSKLGAQVTDGAVPQVDVEIAPEVAKAVVKFEKEGECERTIKEDGNVIRQGREAANAVWAKDESSSGAQTAGETPSLQVGGAEPLRPQTGGNAGEEPLASTADMALTRTASTAREGDPRYEAIKIAVAKALRGRASARQEGDGAPGSAELGSGESLPVPQRESHYNAYVPEPVGQSSNPVASVVGRRDRDDKEGKVYRRDGSLGRARGAELPNVETHVWRRDGGHGEWLWRGSLQLNRAATCAVGFMNQEHLEASLNLPDMIEIKGRVKRLEMEPFIEHIYRTKSRVVTVVPVCATPQNTREGSARNEQCMHAVAKEYLDTNKVGLSTPLPDGVTELYFFPVSGWALALLQRFKYVRSHPHPNSIFLCAIIIRTAMQENTRPTPTPTSHIPPPQEATRPTRPAHIPPHHPPSAPYVAPLSRIPRLGSPTPGSTPWAESPSFSQATPVPPEQTPPFPVKPPTVPPPHAPATHVDRQVAAARDLRRQSSSSSTQDLPLWNPENLIGCHGLPPPMVLQHPPHQRLPAVASDYAHRVGPPPSERPTAPPAAAAATYIPPGLLAAVMARLRGEDVSNDPLPAESQNKDTHHPPQPLPVPQPLPQQANDSDDDLPEYDFADASEAILTPPIPAGPHIPPPPRMPRSVDPISRPPPPPVDRPLPPPPSMMLPLPLANRLASPSLPHSSGKPLSPPVPHALPNPAPLFERPPSFGARTVSPARPSPEFQAFEGPPGFAGRELGQDRRDVGDVGSEELHHDEFQRERRRASGERDRSRASTAETEEKMPAQSDDRAARGGGQARDWQRGRKEPWGSRSSERDREERSGSVRRSLERMRGGEHRPDHQHRRHSGWDRK